MTPNPNWLVTVQAETPGIPGSGYVQIDDVSDGQNCWSKGPKTLRAEGYEIPDFSKLPSGQYRLRNAAVRAAELADDETNHA